MKIKKQIIVLLIIFLVVALLISPFAFAQETTSQPSTQTTTQPVAGGSSESIESLKEKGFEITQIEGGTTVKNIGAKPNELVSIEGNKFSLTEGSEMEIRKDGTIKLIGEAKSFEFGETKLEEIKDATIKKDEKQIVYAKFLPAQDKDYVFKYENKKYKFSKQKIGKEVVFDPKKGEIKLNGGDVDIGKEGSISSIKSDNKISILLDRNGNPRVTIYENGGTYKDQITGKTFSSKEKFTVFLDGTDISKYKENAISLFSAEKGYQIDSKGTVEIKDEKGLVYNGLNKNVYTQYLTEGNNFNVKDGNARINNGQNEVLMENGKIKMPPAGLASPEKAESFSVKYTSEGKESQYLILDKNTADGKPLVAAFSETEKGKFLVSSSEGNSDDLKAKIVNERIKALDELGNSAIKRLNTKIEGIEKIIPNLKANDKTEAELQLAALYAEKANGAQFTSSKTALLSKEDKELYSKAISYLQEAKKNPEYEDMARLSLSEVYKKQGNFENARTELLELASTGKNDIIKGRAYMELTAILSDSNNKNYNPARAGEILQKAIQLDPTNEQYKQVGRAYEKSFLKTISSAVISEVGEAESIRAEAVGDKGFFKHLLTTGVSESVPALFGRLEYDDLTAAGVQARLTYQSTGAGFIDILRDKGYSFEQIKAMSPQDMGKAMNLPIDSLNAEDRQNAIQRLIRARIAVKEAFTNADIQKLERMSAGDIKGTFLFESGGGYVNKEFLRKDWKESVASELSNVVSAVSFVPFAKLGTVSKFASSTAWLEKVPLINKIAGLEGFIAKTTINPEYLAQLQKAGTIVGKVEKGFEAATPTFQALKAETKLGQFLFQERSLANTGLLRDLEIVGGFSKPAAEATFKIGEALTISAPATFATDMALFMGVGKGTEEIARGLGFEESTIQNLELFTSTAFMFSGISTAKALGAEVDRSLSRLRIQGCAVGPCDCLQCKMPEFTGFVTHEGTPVWQFDDINHFRAFVDSSQAIISKDPKNVNNIIIKDIKTGAESTFTPSIKGAEISGPSQLSVFEIMDAKVPAAVESRKAAILAHEIPSSSESTFQAVKAASPQRDLLNPLQRIEKVEEILTSLDIARSAGQEFTNIEKKEAISALEKLSNLDKQLPLRSSELEQIIKTRENLVRILRETGSLTNEESLVVEAAGRGISEEHAANAIFESNAYLTRNTKGRITTDILQEHLERSTDRNLLNLAKNGRLNTESTEENIIKITELSIENELARGNIAANAELMSQLKSEYAKIDKWVRNSDLTQFTEYLVNLERNPERSGYTNVFLLRDGDLIAESYDVFAQLERQINPNVNPHSAILFYESRATGIDPKKIPTTTQGTVSSITQQQLYLKYYEGLQYLTTEARKDAKIKVTERLSSLPFAEVEKLTEKELSALSKTEFYNSYFEKFKDITNIDSPNYNEIIDNNAKRIEARMNAGGFFKPNSKLRFVDSCCSGTIPVFMEATAHKYHPEITTETLMMEVDKVNQRSGLLDLGDFLPYKKGAEGGNLIEFVPKRGDFAGFTETGEPFLRSYEESPFNIMAEQITFSQTVEQFAKTHPEVNIQKIAEKALSLPPSKTP